MKKNIYLIIILLFAVNGYSQNKTREKTRETMQTYAGISGALVFFTHPDVYDIYPGVNFYSSNFLTEVNVFYGIKPLKYYALEFSPSILIAKTQDRKGFYFTQNNQRDFYVPLQSNLLAFPLNIKAKVFPVAGKQGNILSNLFLGISAGVMYIREEYDSDVYTDSVQTGYIRSQTDNNSLWNGNAQFSLGFEAPSQLGYSFEVSYRIVPLNPMRDKPLASSNAANFNSVNVSAKILFNF